jgi:hypothetical protein
MSLSERFTGAGHSRDQARMLANDLKYRFVIDMASLQDVTLG